MISPSCSRCTSWTNAPPVNDAVSTPEDQTNIQMPGETTQQFVERRRHTWIVREWIAIACTAALMLVLGIALFHEVPKANEAIVTNGEDCLKWVVLIFVGGKALVEAAASRVKL